jgi:putative ABC transport system permease protein
MFTNYLKVAFRNINRQKGYAFINIAGLAVGMACCILLLLWVQDEFSYDGFHENIENLYRVEQDQKTGDQLFHVSVTPYPMGRALVAEIPEIADATRYDRSGQLLVSYQDASYYETGTAFVDPGFLRMFTFPLVKGDARKALDSPNSIVISETLAAKYFGAEEPIGKFLRVHGAYDFQVTGVVKDMPRNSELRAEILIPFEFLKSIGIANDSWRSNEVPVYIQLREGISLDAVTEKILALLYRHAAADFPDEASAGQPPPKGQRDVEFSLLPVKDIHLYAYFGYETASSESQKIWILSAIGMFILLIACINFMNLATARAAKRAKEVGLRKVSGAGRGQIARQFYGESLIYSALALVLAALIVELFLPAFNTLTEKNLSLGLANNGLLLAGMLVVALFSGVVAGSYPALFLSSLEPVAVLGKNPSRRAGSAVFRKVLVVTQFALSIFVIVATIVVARQTAFMKKTNLGYDREHMLRLAMQPGTADSYAGFRSELLADARILRISGSSQPISYMSSNAGGAEWDGKPPGASPLINLNLVDYDFVETMGIEMKEGRTFSRTHPGDTLDGCLINEELAKLMGKDPAVGARFSFAAESRIVGVMKNFHFQPLTNKIEPLVLYLAPGSVENLYIRLAPGDVASAIAFVKKTWEKVFPQMPFTYRFLDEDFDRLYRAEDRLGTLMTYFSALAIFIACLGLYGLASFVAEQRTKEIGIRKTLGATIPGIVRLLSKEFLLLVVIAFLVAVPLAWYGAHRWLENFAYRVDIGWATYFSAGAISILVAFVAVAYHAIKAARANPVESLKYE